jgi:hypothetical protein
MTKFEYLPNGKFLEKQYHMDGTVETNTYDPKNELDRAYLIDKGVIPNANQEPTKEVRGAELRKNGS